METWGLTPFGRLLAQLWEAALFDPAWISNGHRLLCSPVTPLSFQELTDKAAILCTGCEVNTANYQSSSGLINLFSLD